MDTERQPSPYRELERATWARLAGDTAAPLDREQLAAVRSLGDPVGLDEVREVYVPLAQLVRLHLDATQSLDHAVAGLLGEPGRATPFVLAVAGSVAVGKSTIARVLRLLLSAAGLRTALVTTDGFLFPNAELVRRGLLARKGFPESYDRRALLRFVAEVKAGRPRVSAPVYSHLAYDVVPGRRLVVDRPDVLVLEGLTVLQPPLPRADGRVGLAVSDFVDLSVYVDARSEDVRRWYVERFLQLRDTAFRDPASYFHRYADLDEAAATARGETIWDAINGPNLARNIAPTRGRADVVLHKGSDHAVTRVALRRP